MKTLQDLIDSATTAKTTATKGTKLLGYVHIATTIGDTQVISTTGIKVFSNSKKSSIAPFIRYFKHLKEQEGTRMELPATAMEITTGHWQNQVGMYIKASLAEGIPSTSFSYRTNIAIEQTLITLAEQDMLEPEITNLSFILRLNTHKTLDDSTFEELLSKATIS